jgi:hypothetical protein
MTDRSKQRGTGHVTVDALAAEFAGNGRCKAMTTERVAASSREETIELLQNAWERCTGYVDGLTDDEWTLPRDAAGWSVKDHVAHVTQWDVAVIELLTNGTALAETLDVPDDEWQREDYDAMNARLRLRTIDDDVDRVKRDRDETWAAFLGVLEGASDALLAKHPLEAGLNAGDDCAPTLLQELPDYAGGHYTTHLGYIRAIIEGAST